MHDSPAYLMSALQAGASGYVLKSAASEELLEAIDSALKGRHLCKFEAFERKSGAVPGFYRRCNRSSP